MHERELWSSGAIHIGGLDEVGAGPWAGPLMAACVVLDPTRLDPLLGVDDSKRLSAAQRETLSSRIRENATAWAIAEVSVEEIDRLNIRVAAILGMERALASVVAALGDVHALLVDAHTLPSATMPQRAIIKGDATSLSIAAASIVAKVERDAMMTRLSEVYPGYGFERHKGYGTAEHRGAIDRLGPTPLHRRSFAPVRALLSPEPTAPGPRQRELFT
ncbi:MAG: ribonuclease HII [Deltaproteobacteria bacterium]|nr:ribonuclease HII [Deltaproteobacteria bacterium]